jgi:outer membrane receptor protein involved in Fe transport
MRLLSLYALGALFALSASPAAAQDAPDHTARTTLTPAPAEDPRFAAGSVTSLPLDDLAPGASLADAMLAAPGVAIQRQSSYGQPAFLSVRGGTPRQLVVLLNGVHVRLPVGLGFDLGSMGAEALSQAALWRGPAAAIFGAGALTGALELRTWQPDAQGWTARARSAGGSFGTWELGGRASAADGPWHAAASASWRASAGDFAFVDEQGSAHQRLNNDHTRLQSMGAAGWSDGQTQAQLVALYERGEAGVAGPGEFQRALGGARGADQRLVGAASVRARDLAAGAWGAMDGEAALGLHWRAQRYQNPRTILGGGALHTSSTLLGVEASAQPMWTFRTVQNFLVARAEGRVEGYTGLSDAPGAVDIEATRWTGAVGVVDEQLWGDLSLMAALRAERVEDEVRGFTLMTPALGARYQAARWLVLRASAAQTARAPDLDELYLREETVRGFDGLRPETARSAEVGVRMGRARDVWGLELTGFVRRTDDLILFLPVTSYLFEATNLARSDAHGAEICARLAPHPRTSLRGAYTWTQARLDGVAGLPVPGQPQHRAQLRAEADAGRLARWLPDAMLYTLLDARSPIALDAFGRQENPALVTLDAGLRVSPFGWFTLGIEGKNLFDVRTGVDSLQRPLPGRALYVSLGVAGQGGW